MASCFAATPPFRTLSNASLPLHCPLNNVYSRLFNSSNLDKGVRFQPPEENSLYHVVTVYAARRTEKGSGIGGKTKKATRKALSIILRREAAGAEIEKKAGPTNSKKLLPRTVLEALTDRIDNNQWEAALKQWYMK